VARKQRAVWRAIAEDDQKRKALDYEIRTRNEAGVPAAKAALVAIATRGGCLSVAQWGFFDTPSCLADPTNCLPGYTGAPFLEPHLHPLR
jgi:hypothetical protein